MQPDPRSSIIIGKVSTGCGWPIRALLALWLCLASILAADSPGNVGKLVRQIRFECDGPVTQISEPDLRSLVSLQEGEPLTPLRADYTVRQIFATDLFWDVQILSEPVDDSHVDIVVHLVRKYLIGSIRFDGSVELENRDLRRDLAFREGEPFSESALEKTLAALLSRYQREGYYQARINPAYEADIVRARLTVRFQIEAGPRATTSQFTLDIDGPSSGPALQDSIQTRPNGPFSEAQLDSDIETIRKLLARQGYFHPEIYVRDGVRYSAQDNSVDAVLRIVMRQQTLVEFEGIELSDEELNDLPVFADPRPRQIRIRETVDFLRERLQHQGYFLAEVSAEKEGTSFPPTRIRFLVRAGRTYDLARIEIEGSALPNNDEVLQNLRTRRAGLVSRGLLTDATLDSDTESIRAWHQHLGYLDAKVTRVFREEDENLILLFRIEPGVRYSTQAVQLVGTSQLDSGDISRSLLLRKGEPYSPLAVKSDQAFIEAYYANRGFRSVSVTSEVARNGGDQVSVTFRVEEGPLIRTRGILVSGNRITRDSVIRTEIPLEPGAPLSRNGLLRGETNLYRLAVFSKVKVKELPSFENPDERSVLFSVEESRRYLLSYGAGYSQSFGGSSSEGLRGTLGITNSNFRGLAHTLAVNLRAGSQRQRANVAYTLPRILGKPLPTVFSFAVDNENRIETVSSDLYKVHGRPYDSFRIIGSAQSEKVLSRKESLFMRYNFEKVDLTVPPDLEAPLELYREENVLLSAVSVTYLNESRFPTEDPTRGFFLSGEAMLTAKVLGSERQFLRFLVQGRHYYPLYSDLTLVTALRIGVLAPFGCNPTDVGNPVPISERFFAGGASTLRGLPQDLAGPLVRDALTGEPVLVGPEGSRNAVAEGGNALIVGNTELRFPLFRRLSGAIFHDIGNVFESIRAIPGSQFTNSVGGGIFVKTPIGPIRVDVAYNPAPPPIEGFQRWNVHLNIGHPF